MTTQSFLARKTAYLAEFKSVFLAWSLQMLTNTIIPPAGPDGWQSTVEMSCLHCWNGRLLSLLLMFCAPWIFSPSNDNIELSWNNPSRLGVLLSKVE
jgi:hypothetical protein